MLDLSKIAAKLEALEETIIYKLIDRVQYCINESVYQPGKSGFADAGDRSLFELRLFYQESMDAYFGRFKCPDERPFNSDIPHPKRIVVPPYEGLAIDDFNIVNLTNDIKKAYLKLLYKICPAGDDSQYGSTTEHDVYALQAISKRIHFGAFFVAECKFQESPEIYTELIKTEQTDEILKRITRPEVEKKILNRVREKVTYIQTEVNTDVRNLIDPEKVLNFYKNTIIPLTKQGELIYFLNRKISP